MFYLAIGLSLTLLTWLVFRWSGFPITGTILLYYALSGLGQAYLLGLIHFLDHSASDALARFRPVRTSMNPGIKGCATN